MRWLVFILAFSTLSCSTPQRAPAFSRNCGDAFWIDPDYSLKIEPASGDNSVPLIEREKFMTYQDVLEYSNRPIDFRRNDRYYNPVTLRQVMRPAAELSKEVRKLIDQILDKAKDPKYIKRGISEQFQKNSNDYLENMASFGEDPQVSRKHLKRHKGSIYERCVEAHLNGVEVGAWRIELKSGKVLTAFFTSSLAGEIKGDDFSAAFSKITQDNNASYNDILKIQFFHNHPRSFLSSLSGPDVETANRLHKIAAAENPDIVFEMIAISQVPTGEVVLFSVTLGKSRD